MGTERLDNYYIVNLDGLDVSGKETFSKNLESYLNKIKLSSNSEYVKRWEIRVVSFPDYDGLVGDDIRNELKKPIECRDGDILDYLFKLDRKFKMREVMKEVYDNPNKFFIIILDRYYLSNLLYSLAHMIFVKNEVVAYDFKGFIENTKPWKQFFEEQSYLPTPDKLVMFSYGKTDRPNDFNKAKQKHIELIRDKSGKDSNETPLMQNYVNLVINDVLEARDFWNELPFDKINIRIGTNFGNDIYERYLQQEIGEKSDKWWEKYRTTI